MQESLKDVKSEYDVYEDLAVGKIKGLFQVHACLENNWFFFFLRF